ncbi:4Fe-4S binding protein [Desulfovibrio sp. OttesenSCG-928-M14]|nr:4Fe-4S binding protein [Desulfovibrio sp. OttesenSCG-928-M14]
MNPPICHVLCFSPTGTSRKLAIAVAEGLGMSFEMCDFTLPVHREYYPRLGEYDVLLVSVPVYYGRVVKVATEYLAGLKGAGHPALLLVNYGNRHYDDALLELYHLAKACAVVPLAAGAFVSEHSFSTADFPMAAGRPDADDLDFARSFGARVAKKLALGGKELDGLPGNAPYKAYPDFHRAPLCNEKCTLCGYCAAICPTGAIRLVSGELRTDEQACIVCQACVKFCPEQARADVAPGALETRRHLLALTAERREPEIFL